MGCYCYNFLIENPSEFFDITFEDFEKKDDHKLKFDCNAWFELNIKVQMINVLVSFVIVSINAIGELIFERLSRREMHFDHT